MAWPVRTARLSLRPATPDDLDACWAFRRLPEVGEWISRDFSDREVWAEQFLKADRLASSLVIERDGRVIGDLMLLIEDMWSQAEVAEQAAGRAGDAGLDARPGVRRPGLCHRGGRPR